MPLAYSIDRLQRVITISGEYSNADDWRDVLERILADPHCEPGYAYLRDLREATRPVDAATVVSIIDVVRRFWPTLQPSRVAVVTAMSVDPAALVAHALADAQRMPLQAFNSYDAALDWLRRGRAGATGPS